MSGHLEPQNMALFADRVFADVIGKRRSYQIRGTWYPHEKAMRHSRRKASGKGADCSYTVTNQGAPRMARNTLAWKKA